MTSVDRAWTTNPEREPFVDAVEAGEFLHYARVAFGTGTPGRNSCYPLGQGKRRVWRFGFPRFADAIRARSVDYPRQSPAPREETI